MNVRVKSQNGCSQTQVYKAIKPGLRNCIEELFQFRVWWFTLIAHKKCFGPSIQEVWEPSCWIVASIRIHCAMDQYHRQSISLLLSLGSVLVLLDLAAQWWEVVCTAQRVVRDTIAERKAINRKECSQREKDRRRQQLWKVFAEGWDCLKEMIWKWLCWGTVILQRDKIKVKFRVSFSLYFRVGEIVQPLGELSKWTFLSSPGIQTMSDHPTKLWPLCCL